MFLIIAISKKHIGGAVVMCICDMNFYDVHAGTLSLTPESNSHEGNFYFQGIFSLYFFLLSLFVFVIIYTRHTLLPMVDRL